MPLRIAGQRQTLRRPCRLQFQPRQQLLLQVLPAVGLKVLIHQVLLQQARQRGRRVLDRGHVQLGGVLEVLGNPQVVNHILGLVDKLLVDLQQALRVHLQHLKVVLQDVDDALVQLLEQRQQVVDQEAKRRQHHVVVNLRFTKVVLQERVDLALHALALAQEPLVDAKQAETPAKLRQHVVQALVAHVVDLGRVVLLDAHVQVLGVLDDEAHLGQMVQVLEHRQVQEHEGAGGQPQRQVLQCHVALALADQDVYDDEQLVHDGPQQVLQPQVQRAHHADEAVVGVGGRHEDGLDVLGLGRRHFDLGGALDEFLVGGHGPWG